MSFFSGLRVIVGLELRQRVRGVSWYVLLGIFVLLVGLVTLLVGVVARSSYMGSSETGGWLYSLIIYFVLLLGTLIAPALSGNAVNGERDSGTLATMQVTLVSSTQIVLGKFVASWIATLAFLVASTPFLLISSAFGGLAPVTVLLSLLALALELGVITALGVGLSAILTRPLFSIVVSYLAVAALSLGTLIAFGLGGIAVQSEVRSTTISPVYSSSDGSYGESDTFTCGPPSTSTYSTPRFDIFWPILSMNPYVVLADITPGQFDVNGNPQDLFTAIGTGVRSAQIAPDLSPEYDYCSQRGYSTSKTSEEVYASTVPSWFVGLALHLVLAAGALSWGIARTKTPARRLASGSRVA
jgi:ABC-type transport system involved in multi-copper enzyme maturation permease subunit